MFMKSRSSTNTRIIRKRNLGGVGGRGKKNPYIHTYIRGSAMAIRYQRRFHERKTGLRRVKGKKGQRRAAKSAEEIEKATRWW